MGTLISATGSSVPVQRCASSGLEAGRPALALVAVGLLTGHDAHTKAARHVSTSCAKRIVDNWVAGAIARHERQVTDSREPRRPR